MEAMSVQEIVRRLQAASDAYYNSGRPIMSDDEYDALREQLEDMDPENPFLTSVGAQPKDKTVKLPYSMSSLNKIKPGTGAVAAYAAKASQKAWVLSEKLDGISALWYRGRLYLRGDGENGVDVSIFAPYIQGLKACGDMAVRGELITPRGVVEGTLARSWVNGQLHQKKPIPEELRKIRFVAYEIVNEPLGPMAQFTSLKKLGFLTPWNMLVGGKLTDELLGAKLLERREKSEYDTDGIVVCENIYVENPKVVKNPTHKVAFKMLLGEQCAETTVRVLEWNPSAQGYLIPRLQIEPVVVGSARIEFVTAHNARFVKENKLGPGAKIVIRRSGDVIPAVERVIQGCAEAQMPTEFAWKWLGGSADAAHIMLDTEETPKEVFIARLVIFAKTMDIAGMGPGVATKLVEAGLLSPGLVLAAGEAKLVAAVGKANGAKLQTQLVTLMTPGKTTESQWMVASSVLPRGVGETKLKVLFDTEKDPRKWHALPVVPVGWSSESLSELTKTLGPYAEWRAKETPTLPYPIIPAAQEPVAAVQTKGTVCFTGVRAKELEAKLEAAGWKIVDSVSSKTNILIVPDGPVTSTGKVKKAQELGTVRILEISKVAASVGIF